MDKVIQYIVVRKDLEMGTGKVAAQVAHASLKIVLETPRNNAFVQEWLGGQFTKCVLRIKSFHQLEKLSLQLSKAGIAHSQIWDAGLTEIQRETERGTFTCIGVVPLPKSVINPFVKRLQLY